MQSALSSWDRAIGDFEVMVGPADAIANADIHVALGTVYLTAAGLTRLSGEFACCRPFDPRAVDVRHRRHWHTTWLTSLPRRRRPGAGA